MSIMEIQKKFYEEKTGGFFDTLAAAKKGLQISAYPPRLAAGRQDDREAYLYAYGESCGTVKVADEEIADMLTDKQ